MTVSLAIFTLFHVLLSLIGIVAGLVVVFGLMRTRWMSGWNTLFFVTTTAATLTGFLFPFHKFLPSHAIGIISSVLLAVAVFALNKRRLASGWRRTYVVTSVIVLYLNTFILIVQLFEKVPALKELAPTQSELPFKMAQVITLVVFILLGTLAAKGFNGEQARSA